MLLSEGGLEHRIKSSSRYKASVSQRTVRFLGPGVMSFKLEQRTFVGGTFQGGLLSV